MTPVIHRIRSIVASIVRPPSPSLVDAVFNGAHFDPPTPTTDHGPAIKAGSRIDRLRSQRSDLAAALRSDDGAPERELTIWPPAARREPCRAC